MNAVQRSYIKIHIAVLLFGLTAILGGLIELNALVLVWWRMLITSISLIFLIRRKRLLQSIDKPLLIVLVINGIIIAIHWLCFYGSIKLANASVALVCMASASFFTALIEPWFLKRKIRRLDIFTGMLIIPGMILIVNNIRFDMLWGFAVGIMAALLSAVFATINKKYVDSAHATDITFIELGTGWLFLSVLLPFIWMGSVDSMNFWPVLSDWIYLIILSLLCTTLAFILSLQSLKHLSAFNANLIVNLEPVYGILLAAVILSDHEELTTGFYIGVLFILCVVFSYPLLKKTRWLSSPIE